MASRLINVRLDPERVRKARALRRQGVSLSDVVRAAIDNRFQAVQTAGGPEDVKTIVQNILRQFPDPGRAMHRRYDVHDRRQARAAIRRALRSRRTL